ncbi:kinase inhibitor [Pokkaliibacter plantistimulans]|uniref:Kinase inhibitor n=2 Tax=Pseudomonadota TaxID=1224 RepID=A0ABX5LQ99_9GAMM|nr:YbhB/YbcL family Raf kinase inhibitor-like protein [Pokkaliibacter plantistimulans]PXF28841.1 kinase inhibitor [Pokkaliibacter plantistimulans]
MSTFAARMAFPAMMLAAVAANAGAFELTSTDMANGQPLTSRQEYQGFGCSGDNLSPQLSWSGAPAGTKAFAVFAYDPDAPTGSGWWHWQVVNIPAGVSSLATGAGDPARQLMPAGAVQRNNDYGQPGFGGACPPQGQGVHRYQFTVYALASTLELPENASAALTGYMVKANALGSATLEALYQRP